MDIKLFDSELKVMDVLWHAGDTPAKDIAKQLTKELGWNVNTTYTLIKRCIKKGAIERSEPGFMCHALIPKSAVQEAETNELIDKIPGGDFYVPVKGAPAAGSEACNILEQPRGEVYYYCSGNGTKNLERMRIRTPTTQNIAGMTVALKGCDLADVNMIVLTIDPCISCTER